MGTRELLDDIRIIDADTHVIEPPDLFTSRVSTKKWGDLVPHVRWDETAAEAVSYTHLTLPTNREV